jgi:hypothetical protein
MNAIRHLQQQSACLGSPHFFKAQGMNTFGLDFCKCKKLFDKRSRVRLRPAILKPHALFLPLSGFRRHLAPRSRRMMGLALDGPSEQSLCPPTETKAKMLLLLPPLLHAPISLSLSLYLSVSASLFSMEQSSGGGQLRGEIFHPTCRILEHWAGRRGLTHVRV